MEWNDSIKVSKEDRASMDATNKNQLKTEKERVPVVAQDALMRLDCLKVKIECEIELLSRYHLCQVPLGCLG